jgi:hypothetical protein
MEPCQDKDLAPGTEVPHPPDDRLVEHQHRLGSALATLERCRGAIDQR